MRTAIVLAVPSRYSSKDEYILSYSLCYTVAFVWSGIMLRRAMPIFKGLPVCFQVPENQKKLDVQRILPCLGSTETPHNPIPISGSHTSSTYAFTHHIVHHLKTEHARPPPLQQGVQIPVVLARKCILDRRLQVPVMTFVGVEHEFPARPRLGTL